VVILGEAIRRLAVRCRRFSWFSWGFLFAVYLGGTLVGILSLLFPVVVTTVTTYGTSTTTSTPWWAYLVGFVPPVVLLTLTVRELVLGLRESRAGVPAPLLAGTGSGALDSMSWTESVRQAQQTLTSSRSDVEWSFVPLVLGTLGFASLTLGEFLALFTTTVGGIWIILPLVIGVPFLTLFWPFHRAALRWINVYQDRLSRQGKELSALENEFFWRFAGIPSPG